MWQLRYIRRIDMRMVALVLCLMFLSLITISSYSSDLFSVRDDDAFMTPLVKSQLKWFVIGGGLFFFFAAFDYNKLREWAWIIYTISIFALIGLFFCDPIQRVHRWYRLPLIQFNVQPSEYAKLGVIIAMSWFLERRANETRSFSTAFFIFLIVAIPFVLILKQPDLGTAMVLFPLALVMGYFGDLNPTCIRLGGAFLLFCLLAIFLIFSGLIPYEQVKPLAGHFLKEYQFERLNPRSHHGHAAVTAIAIGGMSGVGFKESEYARGGSLPTPYTDSIFSAFGEEFGFIGLAFLLLVFYGLLYCSFQVTCVAKDSFGRLLAAGISAYLAVHVIVNVGMMCGLLPITGVPLVLMSYGGSSVVSTMIAIGILQSIYSRRFMF
jgi:rod shape determining protein RodA